MGIKIREVEERDTELGRALYIKMHAPGYRPMPWSEVWRAFESAYPDRWAVQTFPPHDQLVDGKAVYHLFVLDHESVGLNIR